MDIESEFLISGLLIAWALHAGRLGLQTGAWTEGFTTGAPGIIA